MIPAKYGNIFLLSLRNSFFDYKSLIGLSLFIITCLIIFSHLWQFATARFGSAVFDPRQLLWYIALNEWVLVAIPQTQESMERDVRSGTLAYSLPRPISYIGATLSEGLGQLTANLIVLGIVAFGFAWWETGMIPFTTLGLILSIILGFVTGLLGVLFRIVIGLSAFWVQEVDPFYWVFEKLLFMFGGLMLPLTMYPGWMQTIAALTPFPLLLGGRSQLAIHFDWPSVAMLGISWIGWMVVASVLITTLYKRGLRILHIEGG